MSIFQDFLAIDLSRKKETPADLVDYFRLAWLYPDLQHFLKPSPDQLVEEQKTSGARVQIIKKGSNKVSSACSLLNSAPQVKPKQVIKHDLQQIFQAS